MASSVHRALLEHGARPPRHLRWPCAGGLDHRRLARRAASLRPTALPSPAVDFCHVAPAGPRWYASPAAGATASGAGPGARDEPTPAHLSYRLDQLRDMPTLLLVARSAVDAEHRDQSFWRSCSLQAQRLMRAASVEDLALFAEAAAQSSFRDDELMYNVGDEVVARLGDLSTDTLAVVLRTHALLRFRNDRVVVPLQQALFEQMQRSRATAPGLSSSLLSLARLSSAGLAPEPPKELLQAAGRMVGEHLTFFSAPQLCEVVEAYAALRLRGDRQASALFVGVGGALAREPEKLTAEHCSGIVRAFAKIRVHDERLLTALAGRLREKDVRGALGPERVADTLYGFAKFTCQDTALLDLLSIEARRCLHLMTMPLLSTVLASLAKAGVSSQVLTSRAAVLVKRLEAADVDGTTLQEHSTLCMAFGKLQARDDKLFEVLADSLLRRSSPPLAQADCGELVNIMHAFTKVHSLHTPLYGTIANILLGRFGELQLRDVVKYLHGIAKVEYLPSPPLQEKIAQSLQSDRLSQLGVFDLLKLATAARRLGLKSPALEAHVTAVLPNEADGGEELAGPGRRKAKPGPGKKKRQSCRKRKWTW